MRARGPGRQVHGSRCERPVAVGESGKLAGGKGGQVGTCQRGLDKGVGGEVFSGEDLEPERVFGVWSAGV
jgi:hypothetical protein